MKFKIEDLVRFLEIKKPYEIRIISKTKKSYAGAHWGWVNTKTKRIKNHEIHIYMPNIDSPRGFNTLIAHELIHAWQAENKKLIIDKKKHHGPEFILMAKEVGKLFNLPGIYNKELDTL